MSKSLPQIRSCPQCQKEFSRNSTARKFCSETCLYKFRYERDKIKILKTKKLYYKKNKTSINGKKTIYKAFKRKTNVLFKLKDNLRSRLNKALKGNYKTGSAIEELGCSIAYFKIRLQLSFYRRPKDVSQYMSWDNYGEWEIDHIRSLDSFDLSDPQQLKIACNYKNLQPLWKEENKKKSYF